MCERCKDVCGYCGDVGYVDDGGTNEYGAPTEMRCPICNRPDLDREDAEFRRIAAAMIWACIVGVGIVTACAIVAWRSA